MGHGVTAWVPLVVPAPCGNWAAVRGAHVARSPWRRRRSDTCEELEVKIQRTNPDVTCSDMRMLTSDHFPKADKNSSAAKRVQECSIAASRWSTPSPHPRNGVRCMDAVRVNKRGVSFFGGGCTPPPSAINKKNDQREREGTKKHKEGEKEKDPRHS